MICAGQGFGAAPMPRASKLLWAVLVVSALLPAMGCGTGATATFIAPSPPPLPPALPAIVVNSLDDLAQPPAGTVTLRSALAQAQSGQPITFATSLNGGAIQLQLVGESHSILMGEVYSGMTYQGYAERDYGKSALYAHKDVVIDASGLPDGITIHWAGGDANPARVMAVYGSLTLKHVFVTGGYSIAEPLEGSQPFTLARGGGLAVWGTATLEDCAISGNRISGDLNGSRDRGAYGGGIYANGLGLHNCTVSGNSAIGYGAAGGGIYWVGRTQVSSQKQEAVLNGCAITGNRVTAQHAYGGGVFTLAGGPDYTGWLRMTNCTIARNLVEDHPGIANAGQFYFRGGGVYLGGGSLSLTSCTIAENEVNGQLATFSGSPNMAGGGVAATIGNAHVVEEVEVQHSIVAGNKVSGAPQDWYSGSLLHFSSFGYNRIGVIDFSRILVPAPDWMDLSRKHYPKVGDLDGVTLGEVLALDGAHYHGSILSAGADAGQPAILWYPPAGSALDRIPAALYSVPRVTAGYTGFGVSTDDFLNHVLEKVVVDYGSILGADFAAGFGDMSGVTWYGPAVTWPTDPANASWIGFWRSLDSHIGGQLGMVVLGDDFWSTFSSGTVGGVQLTVTTENISVSLSGTDQRGQTRPKDAKGDIGAIEIPAD